MKKSLLAIAALTAFAGAAQAQSSVTIYGLLDVGIMGQSNSNMLNGSTGGTSAGYGGPGSGTAPRNGNSFGFMQGGQSASRLGFKGMEDIGGGSKVIFTLEQGVNTDNGSQYASGLPGNGSTTKGMGNLSNTGDSSNQGQLFNRGAFAGVQNDKWGTLTLGRQQTLMLDNIGGYDPVNAQQFSPLAFSGQFGGGGTTDNARANGALKLKEKIMGFDVNALYAPGGYAGNNGVGTRLEGQIGYETAKWGIQAITSFQEDATALAGVSYGASLPTSGTIVSPTGSTLAGTNQVNAIVYNTRSTQLTAKWAPLDKLWLKGGFQYQNLGTPSNFQYVSGQPVLPNGSGFSVFSYQAATAPQIKNTFWLGANYDFTPAVKGSLGYYQQNINQNGSGVNQAAGTAATGAQKGRITFISAMAEYYLSKRTNLYAAASQVNFTGATVTNSQGFTGGPTSSTINQQFTYGLGMRHTF
ncbi:porin [Polynucleobacter sp. JS-JIR-II-c23]|uniref:porin n=1 Tax=Polynucleobacter sp. JS-JIR-II-c23 TaxID=1758393 RepID=UPI002B223258|nr:porin [Polynucleobacter sp. JS-JIR-II-c23]MEA9604838.1 porin [Polynucleobacter sp. JS-JIR-II-c23]